MPRDPFDPATRPGRKTLDTQVSELKREVARLEKVVREQSELIREFMQQVRGYHAATRELSDEIRRRMWVLESKRGITS